MKRICLLYSDYGKAIVHLQSIAVFYLGILLTYCVSVWDKMSVWKIS